MAFHRIGSALNGRPATGGNRPAGNGQACAATAASRTAGAATAGPGTAGAATAASGTTGVPDGSRAADRWAAAATAAGLAALIALLLLLGAALVYATGGTGRAWLHMLYLPILLAAFGFGLKGAVATALAAGLAVGPVMPLDVAGGVAQEPLNWMFRTSLFVVVATVAGLLHERAHARHRALAASESRFRALVRNASDLIVVTADDTTIVYASPSIHPLLGLAPEEVAGRPLAGLAYPTDAAALGDLERSSGRSFEVRLRHVDGSWRHLTLVVTDLRADPAVAGFVVNGRDVTEHRAIQAELQYRATHDPLTSLANRTLVSRHLAAALARRPDAVCVLTLNVDRLKRVNETYGHVAGDHLLTAVATRLQDKVRHDDILGRHNGSGLVVATTRLPGAEAARRFAERLRVAVGEPFQIGQEEVYVTATVGVAFGREGHDPDSLLADAYTALRHGKEAGGNRSVVFTPSLPPPVSVRTQTDSALHRAIRNGELRAHFQPIVRSGHGGVAGFEALVRWQHPTLGAVPPREFIPVAEETGLIGDLGRQVLDQACRWLANQRDRHPTARHLWVSVNTSPLQLREPDWADEVQEIVLRSGLPPQCLTLEITETSIVSDAERSIERLARLRDFGVRVAVDDFGTGYSSLGILRELPVDVLKIDRAFVRGLGDDANNAIVSAIIGLSRSLRLTTVAEGVETPAQRRCLQDLGCDLQQGFLYSPARPPQDLDVPALLVGEAQLV